MYLSLGGNCSVAYFLKENKIKRILSPFDWTDSSISQLNSVLENDFENFLLIKKIIDSSYHDSFVLTNYYGIKLAHSLDKETLIFKINNFYSLKKYNDKITFIRIEHKKVKSNYFEELKKLVENLKKFCNNFTLKIILPLESKITFRNDIIEYYFYPEYDEDWKIASFSWNKII